MYCDENTIYPKSVVQMLGFEKSESFFVAMLGTAINKFKNDNSTSLRNT
jgi:hypothetical protein